MFPSVWIVGTVLFGAATGISPKAETSGRPPNITTCEDFEFGVLFSPYSVVDSMWRIFYYWSTNKDLYPVYFSIPTKKSILKTKEIFEVLYPGIEVEWEKSTLIMKPRPGVEILMLYAGTPGAFRALVKQERRTKGRPHPAPTITAADVRMKLVDRWLGIMCCEDLSAFGLVRVDQLPTTESECAEGARKLGFYPEQGRSYLQNMSKKDEEL